MRRDGQTTYRQICSLSTDNTGHYATGQCGEAINIAPETYSTVQYVGSGWVLVFVDNDQRQTDTQAWPPPPAAAADDGRAHLHLGLRCDTRNTHQSLSIQRQLVIASCAGRRIVKAVRLRRGHIAEATAMAATTDGRNASLMKAVKLIVNSISTELYTWSMHCDAALKPVTTQNRLAYM